jgi:uncharacterized repeat protein (TIGR01451 family)
MVLNVRQKTMAGVGVVLMIAAGVLSTTRVEAGGLTPIAGSALPVHGSACGSSSQGTNVTFTIPAADGSLTATPLAGLTATATVIRNTAAQEFSVVSATLNGARTFVRDLISDTATNATWTKFDLSFPGTILDTSTSGSFTRFSMCLSAYRFITITTTVNSGSPVFEYDFGCELPDGSIAGNSLPDKFYPTPGSPDAVTNAILVGATCSPNGSSGPEYTNDLPKSLLVTFTGPTEITINHLRTTVPFPVVGIVKTMEPTVLSATQTSATFVLTVTNTGTSAATNVTVDDPVPAIVTVTGVTGPGTWSEPTWTVGTLQPGQSATLRIAVSVPTWVGAVPYPVAQRPVNCASVNWAQRPDFIPGFSNQESCVVIRRAS